MRKLLVAILLLSSCSAPTQPPTRPPAPAIYYPSEPPVYSVQILSEPPGAHIEINGEYVGRTPCRAPLNTWPTGTLKEDTIIRAIPTTSGQYVQEKFFHGTNGSWNNPRAQHAPARVFFYLPLAPAPPEINVRVR